jgi:hypothetical protein
MSVAAAEAGGSSVWMKSFDPICALYEPVKATVDSTEAEPPYSQLVKSPVSNMPLATSWICPEFSVLPEEFVAVELELVVAVTWLVMFVDVVRRVVVIELVMDVIEV